MRNFVEALRIYINLISKNSPVMKKILVATDFSQGSLKALEYAINLANKGSAEVILMWVNSYHSDTSFLSTRGENVIQEAASQLEKIVAKYTPNLESGKLSYRISQGKVHTELAAQAKHDEVDFVICGTHGASGFEKDFVGSNAHKIVSVCDCPVITVRPNYRFQSPSNIIVLPIDASEDTRQKVTFTARFAKFVGAEIHILGLHSSNVKSLKDKVDRYVSQVECILKKDGVKCITNFRDASNITTGIIMYADSVNADLISIMTEQEGSMLSFVLGTYAQQMIHSSSIPVLSIRPKTLTTATSFS